MDARKGRSGHRAALALCGALALGACAVAPANSTELDRLVYDDALAIMSNSQFAFVGHVESSEGTWYHPIWEDDPNLNPLATGDASEMGEEQNPQQDPIAVTEYTLTVTDPLSSQYQVGDVAAVYQMGHLAESKEDPAEDLVELQIGAEYLLFIWDQTDPGYWTITGIDSGIFSRPAEGDDFQNNNGLTIDADSLVQLADLSHYSTNIRK